MGDGDDVGYIIRKVDDCMGRGVFATKSYQVGETIFREDPLISSQFSWNGFYGYAACHYCMEPLETATANVQRLAADPNILLPNSECCTTRTGFHVKCANCGVNYCSSQCMEEAWDRWHKSLCLGTPFPDPGHPYVKLEEEWRSFHYPPETVSITLFVRILASILQSDDPSEEMRKYMNFVHQTEAEGKVKMVHKMLGDNFAFQIERMRVALCALFPQPEVQELLTPDGFAELFALVGRNGQGIGTSPFSQWVKKIGRLRLNEAEKKAMDDLIDRLYDAIDKHAGPFLDNEGSGLYSNQSMINHSCVPNAQIEFPFNNHELVVNAIKPIEAGEQVTISYIPDCELNRGRHSRQKQLMQNYLFLCQCQKCQEQANDPEVTSDEEMSDPDEDDEDEDSNDEVLEEKDKEVGETKV